MATPTAPHIVEGINLLNQRLLPAKLNQTSPVNSALLFQWLRDLGLNPMNLSAKSLADNLEGQVRKHVMERKLVWDVEPKILRQHLVERIKTDKEYENERTEQRNAVEDAAVKSKEDAATLGRINSMIEGISITTMGRVQFGKTEEAKAGLKKYRDQLIKAKTPLAIVETRIRAAIEKIYDAAEKGQAYSTVWGGA